MTLTRTSGARHAEGATSTIGRLVWRLARGGRVQYVPMLLSDQARLVLERKYDAFATDRAYENRPHGRCGPVGAGVDALVLRFPLHAALRQRLAIVVDALVEEIERAAAAGSDPVRVLSAPCGLARDVRAAAARLDRSVPVVWTGLDLDERGDVLPEAARLAREAGVRIELLRRDLFVAGGPEAAELPFDVVNCVGLTPWLDLSDVAGLAGRFGELAAPGAALLVDTCRENRHSHLARHLDIPARYHPPDESARTLEQGGFVPVDVRPTANGVFWVWIARRRHS